MKKNLSQFNYRFLAKNQLSYTSPICLIVLILALYDPLSMKAQAPNISYSGVAASYPRNVAITSLTPTNSGGAVSGLFSAVSTLAGSGAAGSTDATGTAASFNYLHGIAVDASENVYVSDLLGHKIRKITPSGVVTTLAGSGIAGSTDATGTAARFNLPTNLSVDASGNVYVGDRGNHKIRKITSGGVVTTLAGSGTAGSTDGTGTAASFNAPHGVVVDASGNVYVADYDNHKIRKITSTGVVTTFAGSGTAGSTNATGTAASFNGPEGIALDASGNVYVAEYGGNRIRKITPEGVVTTLAGSGTAASTDGTGTAASINGPSGVAVDSLGNVYVVEFSGHKVRKITPSGVVTTLAGSGTASSTDGTGTAASFNYPISIAVSASNSLYVPDYGGHKVRKVEPKGYSISPALPTGLSMNASGAISGTPTATVASTTYTITGTNISGSSTTSITFSVFVSYKWKGTTTAWSTASNWESNIAPITTSDVVIPVTTNKPTLSANTTVASLTFSGDNQLILGNFNLTANSITGGSSTAYIVTNGTGSLTINSITSARLFPVGPSTTVYAPATITNNLSRNFKVKVGTAITNPISGYKYVNLQWDITPSVLTGNSATLALGWSSGSQASEFNPVSAVQINHYNTNTSSWDISTSATVSGSNPYTATASGISSFSPFSVSNVIVLPVELLDFLGKNTEGGNLLTWTTAEEKNAHDFDIERSHDGMLFTTIGTVRAKGSNSVYEFTDNNPFSTKSSLHSTTYYRLRQIDHDGKESLTKVISISQNKSSKLKAYPSVTTDVLTIETMPPSHFYIFNLLGQEVLNGQTAQRIDVSTLPQGTYILKVGTEQMKFIKQ